VEPWATSEQVWQGALIFCRIGAVLLMLPGIGESYVSPRIRLSLALAVTLVLWPVIVGGLPALPATVSGMAGWVIREVIVGLMIGALLRSFLTALATAGE
jgi:flagellar biosynthetic protein FliR